MDKAGIGALILGLILCALGGYAIWVFFPDVIAVVKGLVGIVVVLVGLILITFGILISRD